MSKVWIMVSSFLFVLAGSIVSASAADKVYTDSDLKGYTSESDEKARAYNYSVIQRDRARRRPAEEAKAEKEFQETIKQNIAKVNAEMAEKIAEKEEENRKKEAKRKATLTPIPAMIIGPNGIPSAGYVIPLPLK